MATQVIFDGEDDEDVHSPHVVEFEATVPGDDPVITNLRLDGSGPWTFTAGRDATRDIVINSSSVSRHHADIGASNPARSPSPSV